MQLWLVAAFASALFAGIVSILAKCGIKTIDSDVATALRTCVVAVFTWVMVAVVGSAGSIGDISPKSWLFLALSGLATGGSWICYFKALSVGDVNKVVPIDKSSTLMAVVLSIVLFNETGDLGLRLAGTAVATAGTFLMIERKSSDANGANDRDYRMSIAYALAAAVFAALTSVLAKVGIEGVESNLATAIRTMFVLAMTWAIVAGKGKTGLVRGANRRELAFLAASGLATGASWLYYYYAIQMGQVSVVVQVDKLSLLVSIAFAAIVFGERLSKRAGIGLALIVAGTAIVAACG
ncbi:EamA family transporter [uncultured Senegalimassilia sp.]|uniref:EamA family transporter n=1 Tax=uncultured Senegalimassilia sp. TaxID=1714350 RepID=UPI0025E178CB|nr:EamA family transporter [uncultured Senegalimassilia sp.]